MATSQDAPFKVIIIGSGLAGSLLANGLIHKGVEVSVHERLPRHADREGYQIRLGKPALVGMRACLTQNQISEITAKFGRAGGLRSGAPILYNKHFQTLLDLSIFPTYSKTAPIGRGVLRDALADPVFEAGKLHYDKQFSRYEILNSGSDNEGIRAWFQDGSYEDGDLLIGADGSHSKVNVQLGLNNINQVKTHISFISKNELPTTKFMKMDPSVRGKPVMSFADKKGIFFCAYLPDKASSANSSLPKEVDDSLSSSMFGCQIPVEDCPQDLLERPQQEKWEFVSSQFSNWSKEYHEIISLVKGTDLYVFHARASVRPSRGWRKKAEADGVTEHGHPRVWLLGDAMHAMLPLRGMGGNQSLCDTATVLPLISKLAESVSKGHSVSTQDIASALSEFEGEMIPRAFEWVEKSGEQNIMAADTSTWRGRLHIRFLGVMMNLTYGWYILKGLFTRQTYVDDAPELRD